MNFILIFGPSAVGKMTVGIELEKLTGIKLFHNHASIEPILNFFEFGTPPFARLVDNFRFQIFNEVANSELPGLIFTFVWDLDSDQDKDFVMNACTTFDKASADVTLIELNADLELRLLRNRHPDRLEAKPSKRDIERSEKNLLECENYRLNTNGFELDIPYKHMSINTNDLTPRQTAQLIVDKLGLDSI